MLTADSFFPAFIAGVETVLADEGQVLVLSVVPEATELGTYRTLASDHRVDGVFLTDLRRDDPRLPLLVELGLPAVTLGRPDSASGFPCVDLDDRPGVEQTVEHLRALGHARIAYVAGDAAMLHGQRRRACFVAAMAAAGLSAPQIEDTDFSATEAALATDACCELQSATDRDRLRQRPDGRRRPGHHPGSRPAVARRHLGRRLRRRRHRPRTSIPP